MSDLLREWNRLPEARLQLQKGLELAEQTGYADYLADAYVVLVRLCLGEQDDSGAALTLHKVDELANWVQFDPYLHTWLDEVRINLWTRSKNESAIWQWIQTSGLTWDGALNYLHDLDHLNLARGMLAVNRFTGQEEFSSQLALLLARLRAAAEQAGWVHETIKILLLQAQSTDQENIALNDLSKALSLAQPGGYVRSFVDEGEALAHLLREAIATGVDPEYGAQLLANCPAPAQLLIEPLSERELEVLQLLATSLDPQQMAVHLVISVSTVRTHIRNIYAKLGVNRRLGAIQRGRELGML
jgi:LuxR family maltose regulon positive regulatory protein